MSNSQRDDIYRQTARLQLILATSAGQQALREQGYIPKEFLQEIVDYFDIKALPAEVYDRILEGLR